ncbi:hypothetical protein RHOER0001_3145 [Rhodococcus erythropolis SK121]|nr:hypothetical protein RHOER0001_3145 [Rhodococcus erythropolis SK121]
MRIALAVNSGISECRATTVRRDQKSVSTESSSGLSSIWTEVSGSHDCEAAVAFAIA